MSTSYNPAEKELAAFIITYEREAILADTIGKLFQQTVAPQKILIVDNSSSTRTEDLIKTLNNGQIEYYKVGYNSGPAGGAKIGLEKLAKEGYKWVFWGDDDDPPLLNNCFETLLQLANSDSACGQVGVVGQWFNRNKGIINRIPTQTLRENAFVEVDTIAGNMCKIIKGDAVLKGIVPTESLFFGFEDLDIDIKLQNNGYKLLVPTSTFLHYRDASGRLNFKRKYAQKIDEKKMWREYFSIKSSLVIFSREKFYSAVFLLLCRKLYKAVVSFKYGMSYGRKNAAMTYFAITDWMTNAPHKYLNK